MALKERIVTDRIEVLEGGAIQVRQCVEVYDDTITLIPAVEGVYEKVEVTPAELAVFEKIKKGKNKGKFREVTPAKAAIFKVITLVEPVSEVNDLVEDVKFHRYAIPAGDTIPKDILDFKNKHKKLICKKFILHDRKYLND